MAVRPRKQKDNFGPNKGANRSPQDPYVDYEYDPQTGDWEVKAVREGKEKERVDWVGGKDIIS